MACGNNIKSTKGIKCDLFLILQILNNIQPTDSEDAYVGISSSNDKQSTCLYWHFCGSHFELKEIFMLCFAYS